jgi:MFS family permease
MIIYSPIYLGNAWHFAYGVSFVCFAVCAYSACRLPYELGYLADTKWGEKELLIGGTLLLAFTTFLCVIMQTSNPIIWMLVLLVSRIGAACVETMAFAYYFKKVGPEDASLTALFSNTLSLATIVVGAVGIIIGPLLATSARS